MTAKKAVKTPVFTAKNPLHVLIQNHPEDVAKRLYDHTQEWWKQYANTEQSDAERIGILIGTRGINKVWSAGEASLMVDILSIVMGQPIKAINKNNFYDYIPGLVIVPLSNPNSHSYTLMAPALCVGGYRFMESNAETGNNMTTEFGSIQPATLKEVVDLVETLSSLNVGTEMLQNILDKLKG